MLQMALQQSMNEAEMLQNEHNDDYDRNTNFEGIGWSARLQQHRAYYFLTLAKEVVIGNALKRGDNMFYYLVNCQGRKALLVFLDGQERPSADATRLGRISFLVKHRQNLSS
jgi:hypothetical protein